MPPNETKTVPLPLTVPVIGILRGVESAFFAQLLPEAFGAGLQALEVTMNTAGALAMVAKNRPLVPSGKLLGMGTIRTLAEAKAAVEVGAMFLVTPNFDPAVVAYGNEQQVPVVVGALTPTEIYAAWQSGAAMVKVFPCQALGGPRYIRDLAGPFEQIPLVAVGGVEAANLADYLGAGAQAVGVSTSLFGRRALAEKKINELTQNVKNFIGCCLQPEVGF